MIYTENFIRNQIEHWCQLKDNMSHKFARIVGMPWGYAQSYNN